MAPSQQAIRTIRSICLEDYDPDSGQVRDDLPPKLGTITKSNFSVDFELIYEVHGAYNKGEEDNASLLVIRLVPKPDDPKRQFAWFRATLTVLSEKIDDLATVSDDQIPTLISTEPASRGEQFADVFTTNETRENTFKASLQAQVQAITPGVEASRNSKSDFKQHHLLKVKSGTGRAGRAILALSRKAANQAWWEVRAANEKDGTGDSLTVAMLIKRPRGSKFHVEAGIDGEIGTYSESLWKLMPSIVRRKKGSVSLDVFGPANAVLAQRLPKGVQVDNLHAASTDNAMRRIDEVGLHLPEQGRLVRYEEGMTGTRLEIEGEKPLGLDNTTAAPNKIIRIAGGSTRDPTAIHAEPEKSMSPIPARAVSAEPPPALADTTDGALQMLDEGMLATTLSHGVSPRPGGPNFRPGRVERLREIAALYERLAELHLEEARECQLAMGYYEQFRNTKDSPSKQEEQGPKDPEDKLLEMIRSITDWDDTDSTRLMEDYIKQTPSFGRSGDKSLLRLILHTGKSKDWHRSIWNEPAGRSLLCWMLQNEHLNKVFVKKPAKSQKGEDEISGRLPIHFAIETKNYDFLTTFIEICRTYNNSQRDPQRPNEVLECTEKSEENCVHAAMNKLLPFASDMVAVCSAKALTDRDASGFTPLHRALEKKISVVPTRTPMPPRPGNSQETRATNITSRESFWHNQFSPPQILEEIKKRTDADDVLPKILTTTNLEGASPYQEHLEKYEEASAGEIPAPGFKSSFKALIFQKVKGIANVSKALYGTSGSVKELCLDMSDFNQSSHNFEKFVEKLVNLDDDADPNADSNVNDAAGLDDDVDLGVDARVDADADGANINGVEAEAANAPQDDGVLRFEDTLFFVHLPDLNYVKQPCPHKTMKILFAWLKEKQHVQTIKKLNIPDNTNNPMSPAFFELNILIGFEIESLDWRTLDLNLDILTGSEGRRNDANMPARPCKTQASLKELTLYSRGNWSVLYHWISKDGLAKLPRLCNVRIDIIHLDTADGVHGKDTHARHLELAENYKVSLETIYSQNKKQYESDPSINFRYNLEIRVNAKWYYPPPPHDAEESTTRAPIHQFAGQLRPCQDFLQEQGLRKFQEYALPPARSRFQGPSPDRRIKIAIIDNGADRIRSSIGEMIAKGISYVTADLLGPDQILPWWMVSDAHGTQMASLIGQINPFCRLYIARVGKGRNDIDPKKAAKAIKWALEQKVDIISMSWTTRTSDKHLERAVYEAADDSSGRATLMFCSTADEGMYSDNIYPADYDKKVVRVSATDRWGHLTSKSHGPKAVNIQIPGENIEAVGPAYIGSVMPHVSGSSVATALAAGIASLALLLLRTYNNADDRTMRRFYTKEGIMRVFNQMDADKGGIQLSKLFPLNMDKESTVHDTLQRNWSIENFPE